MTSYYNTNPNPNVGVAWRSRDNSRPITARGQNCPNLTTLVVMWLYEGEEGDRETGARGADELQDDASSTATHSGSSHTSRHQLVMAALRSRCRHYIFLYFCPVVSFIVVALWNTVDHYIFILWFLSIFYRLCTDDRGVSLLFTIICLFPLKIAPSHVGICTSFNTWFIGPTRVRNANGNLIVSAVFAGLTERQKDWRYGICWSHVAPVWRNVLWVEQWRILIPT